jgi:cation diffusion facilitator CzcD-associated flavoprotein CzcO
MTVTTASAPRVERPPPAEVDAVVVGSGFAGLGAAIQLKKTGRHDFVVLERGDDVGGTWRDNDYPGCRCDVPSHLYSFSFAPNPDWTASFSPQPEIQRYLQRTARDFGVLPHLHLGVALLDARWDDVAQRWHVSTNRGEIVARVLVLGTGALSEPSVPSLPGLDSFAGTTFHSAAWRWDHDLTGRRVAVVGTGASAIQFVPHVQRAAGHMTLFQRTAPWVMPRRDREYGRFERWLYRRLPFLQRVTRAGIYCGREALVLGLAKKPDILRLGERQALRHLKKQVPDPALRAKLTPHYRLGCKRILLANDYYPALIEPNVDVVTDRIVEVLPNAVVTVDAAGVRAEHEVDTIIFGTGFHVTDPPIAMRLRGKDGRTLAEHWSGGLSAHRGLTVAGFPNMFFLIGPNTGLGHNSIVVMIEAQLRYVLDVLEQMDANAIGGIEPRPDVQAAYNERLQRALAGTVWNTGGCSSWYLDANGRNTTIWPTFTFTFHKEMWRCDLSEYDVQPRVDRPLKVPA